MNKLKDKVDQSCFEKPFHVADWYVDTEAAVYIPVHSYPGMFAIFKLNSKEEEEGQKGYVAAKMSGKKYVLVKNSNLAQIL